MPWYNNGGRRLCASMGLATLVIAAILSVLPPFGLRELPPLVSLFVTLLPQEVQRQPEPPREAVSDRSVLEPSAEPASPEARTPASSSAPFPADAGVTLPADQAAERAVRAFRDSQDAIPSPSPGMAEKRRRLRGQHPPLARESPKPIWENAEIDQLGRSVLHHGDCSRVLDDPNVTREYQFRTFDQYLVTCSDYKHEPRELHWVAPLRERYAYLRYPDGSVPGEEDRPP